LRKRIIAVSRFPDLLLAAQLEQRGIEVIPSDLLEPKALDRLPDCDNVIFMAARKFGTTGQEPLTWAMNTYLPGKVAERYAASRIVAFSTGNVYPLVPVRSGGSVETDRTAPAGEYAQSALGRERIFEYWSIQNGTPTVLLRLNYAVDLRYGVLLDIAQKVFEQRPVDLTMPAVNVIWQGDANSVCLRAFEVAQTPACILNVTGPETISVRQLALQFGERFGREPRFEGSESPTALLSNASRCHSLFGPPSVSLDQMIEWVAAWVLSAGRTFGKPTHFEQRAGIF
jgi:nucleoside-diphosphate-sugar epimerase